MSIKMNKYNKLLAMCGMLLLSFQVSAAVPFLKSSQPEPYPSMCTKPLNCAPGANYFSVSDASRCGCCACDGGVLGCSGGAKGRVICANGQTDDNCACQYTLSKE